MARRLLIFLAVVGLLFVAADFIMRQVAEDRLAGRVGAALELEEDPRLELGGWPFVLHALDGNFPEVEVTADTLSARGIVLEDVRVSLRNVRFELGDIISGTDRTVRTGGGRGTAALSASALDAAVRGQGGDATFSFVDGQVVVNSETLGQAAGTPAIEGRTLTISAEDYPEPFSIRLPSIAGATYGSPEVVGGRLVVEMTLASGPLSLE